MDAATEKAIIAVLKDLKEAGKTSIVVHHDLSTVQDYFDHVFLINRSPIAHGPTASNADNLSATYGGKLGAAQLGAALA